MSTTSDSRPRQAGGPFHHWLIERLAGLAGAL
ncbi:hypothetical protein AVHY2522_18730 [Acidovorax sp. SUPP2522]|nr:hypothetical protein AVHY2522_18730 [Acidovorax sp. SUPP2522]